VASLCPPPHKAITAIESKIPVKLQDYEKNGPTRLGGIVVAKETNRTRRVDKGKSGQAQKIAVSGGFGGGILSQISKQAFDSFGGTEWRL